MTIQGEMIIGRRVVRGSAGTTRAFNPATRAQREPAFGLAAEDCGMPDGVFSMLIGDWAWASSARTRASRSAWPAATWTRSVRSLPRHWVPRARARCLRADLLPDALRDDNPLGRARMVDGSLLPAK